MPGSRRNFGRLCVGIEQDSDSGGREGVLKPDRFFEQRQPRPSALLGRLEDDFSQSILLSGQPFRANFRAIRDQRQETADTEFGSFLEHQLETIRLNQRQPEIEVENRIPLLSRTKNRDRCRIAPDGIEPADEGRSLAVKQLDLFADATPMNANGVMKLVAREFGGLPDPQPRRHVEPVLHDLERIA